MCVFTETEKRGRPSGNCKTRRFMLASGYTKRPFTFCLVFQVHHNPMPICIHKRTLEKQMFKRFQKHEKMHKLQDPPSSRTKQLWLCSLSATYEPRRHNTTPKRAKNPVQTNCGKQPSNPLQDQVSNPPRGENNLKTI